MILKEQLTIISTLTLAEMKGRYRNTIAGVLWVMINPLILFGVHALIFKYILKLNVDRYFIFLLGGILPWVYIHGTISQTVHSLITMRESLLSFQIHPISVIISKSIDNFINFLIPFFFLMVVLADQASYNPMGLLFLPIALIILFIGVTSLAIFLSVLQVFFRDTEYISNFMLSIMFFLTPIFYPRHLIPEKYQILVDLNPFYSFIRTFTVTLWDFNYEALFASIINGGAFMIGSVLLARFLWRKTRNELYINI